MSHTKLWKRKREIHCPWHKPHQIESLLEVWMHLFSIGFSNLLFEPQTLIFKNLQNIVNKKELKEATQLSFQPYVETGENTFQKNHIPPSSIHLPSATVFLNNAAMEVVTSIESTGDHDILDAMPNRLTSRYLRLGKPNSHHLGGEETRLLGLLEGIFPANRLCVCVCCVFEHAENTGKCKIMEQ